MNMEDQTTTFPGLDQETIDMLDSITRTLKEHGHEVVRTEETDRRKVIVIGSPATHLVALLDQAYGHHAVDLIHSSMPAGLHAGDFDDRFGGMPPSIVGDPDAFDPWEVERPDMRDSNGRPSVYDARERDRHDAINRLDRMAALFDEQDRERLERRYVLRCEHEPRHERIDFGPLDLPKRGFDHRAANSAPRSQRGRRR
jgi:hypothetical protein